MNERPPIDPPRRPNKPDAPGKMRILIETCPTCWWHDGCPKMHSAPVLRVRREGDRDLVECGACGKRAWLLRKGPPLVNCDVA